MSPHNVETEREGRRVLKKGLICTQALHVRDRRKGCRLMGEERKLWGWQRFFRRVGFASLFFFLFGISASEVLFFFCRFSFHLVHNGCVHQSSADDTDGSAPGLRDIEPDGRRRCRDDPLHCLSSCRTLITYLSVYSKIPRAAGAPGCKNRRSDTTFFSLDATPPPRPPPVNPGDARRCRSTP